MSPSSVHPKKRKASASDSNVIEKKLDHNGRNKTEGDRSALHEEIGYTPLDLKDIHNRIQHLCRRVPAIPDGGFSQTGKTEETPSAEALPRPSQPCPYDKKELRKWATAMQTVLEEFHLLVACASPATYVWGTDRSGAADQNLSLLSNELVRSQEQIMSRVTPRLNDVLAPVVTLVTNKTVTEKSKDGKEVKHNFFTTTHEDPDYVNLCYTILARNAPLLRQVVLANFDKLLQTVHDYLQAQHKDSQHDSRGFVY